MSAAVDSCFWPLYEVVDGRYRLTYKPDQICPVVDWLRPQARFAHLMRPESSGVVAQIQKQVDEEWMALLERCDRDAAVYDSK
jgi:pyruvate ferredoxin oxidoreductase beta subunit